MPTYVKRAGVWRESSNGLTNYVKRAGVWENLDSGAENFYVKRAGVWKQATVSLLASEATLHRRYSLEFPGVRTAQASTAEAVQDRLPDTDLEVIAYSLPGDGTIVVDIAGTQSSATAMTNAVKAALQPWSTVTSLGAI
jgi:hypothetical protein